MKKTLIYLFLLISTFILVSCQSTIVNFKVTFMSDDLIVSVVESEDIESIKMPANPIKENYEFVGWYWDEGEWEKPFTVNSILDQPLSEYLNLTVYAKWKGANVEITYEYDGLSTTIIEYGQSFTLSVPIVNNGDIFLGWQVEEEDGYHLITNEKGQSISNCDFNDINVVPKWKEGKVTLTLDVQGGTCDQMIHYVWFGEKIGQLPTPQRTGYYFLGWSIQPDSTSRISSDDIVSFSESMTIYANWVAVPYTVKFNGGTNAEGYMQPQNFVYGIPQQLNLNTFTVKGYYFVGWQTNDGVLYGDGSLVKFISNTATTVTLTAKWAPITYRVYFKSDKDIANELCQYVDVKYDEYLQMNVSLNKKGNKQIGWLQVNGDTAGKEWPTTANIKNLSSENGSIIELVAIWEQITYEIQYKTDTTTSSNNVICTIENVPYDEQHVLLEPSSLCVKEGYYFGGWKLSTSSTLNDSYVGKVLQPGEIITALIEKDEGRIVVYPYWIQITYTLLIHLDDDQDTLITHQKVYNEWTSVSLKGLSFTKENYTLKAFRIGQQILSISWEDYTYIPNLLYFNNDYSVENGAIVDVYAVWEYNYKGEGTIDSPYILDCPEALYNLSILDAVGKLSTTRYFSITQDIDMDGIDFVPIGIYTSKTSKMVIYGNDHTIYNLNIVVPDDFTIQYRVGFICSHSGVIENLRFENCTIDISGELQSTYVGLVAGYLNASTIRNVELENCIVNVSVEANYVYVGAVTGASAYSIIRNVELENCEINVTNTGVAEVGAFNGCDVGIDNEGLENCTFNGKINVIADGDVTVSVFAISPYFLSACGSQAEVFIKTKGEACFSYMYGWNVTNIYSVFEANIEASRLSSNRVETQYAYYSDKSFIVYNNEMYPLDKTHETEDSNLKNFEWLALNLPIMCTKDWALGDSYPELGHRELKVIEVKTKEEFLSLSGKKLIEKYVLHCDVDLSGIDWEMPELYGVFDGNGHKITGCNVSSSSKQNVSIFAVNYGEIKNLIVENINIVIIGENDTSVAGIVLENYGTIAYCKVTGIVLADITSGTIKIGGISIYNRGEIYACYTDCIFEAKTYQMSSIENCLIYIYGISGNTYGIIEHCYTKGTYTGTTLDDRLRPNGDSIYIYGVSLTAQKCFSLVEITYKGGGLSKAYAVAEGLEACSSQKINGVLQTGISENFLKNETYLLSAFAWQKYQDLQTLEEQKYAAWKFNNTDFPTLYFE